MLELLPFEFRAKGWKDRPLQRCERITKQWLQPSEMTMTTKAELERLWERVESIREELGSLADEIAELYADEEGEP